jgi:hypothetical protein
MDRILHSRESILQILKDNLVMAQNQMNQKENHHHSERSFAVGDMVFL